MPYSSGQHYHVCVRALRSLPRWRDKLAAVELPEDPLPAAAYYDLLAGTASEIEIWITQYLHALEGVSPVADWMASSGLIPYLSVLDAEDRTALIADFDERVRSVYPPQRDGRVLLEVPRLFVLARR